MLKSFCMSCGTSHTLQNTFVCSLAQLGEDTMVQSPMGGIKQMFPRKTNGERGKNAELKPEGPLV